MSRILTTHAGSLPRPPELNSAWADHSRGRPVDRAALDALVESATRGVVRRQAEAGLDVGGDGEQGRESFFSHVRERFSGFGGRGELRPFKDIRNFPVYFSERRLVLDNPGSVSLAQLPAAIDEVEYLGTGPIDAEIALLRQAAEPFAFEQLFVTVPSPGIIATAMTNRHYASIESYVDALAAGLAEEYRAVVEAGLLLQIDAPDLALERHVLYADRPLEDFQAFARHVVAAINRAVAGLPPERIRLHVCWGNYDGPHCYDVPLADMLDTYVVVGCIDTTTNYVEHPEVVADRLLRAVDAVGDPARVMAGTDCGFATSAGTRDVAADVAWEKLAALVTGTSLANDRLGLG